MQNADYVILGGGASGLQLAYRMALDPFFDSKKILLIDKEINKGNDRTWCFWEKGKGEWDDILYKSWDKIVFASEWFTKSDTITPYTYKMVRSKSYYDMLWETVRTKDNIEFLNQEVKDVLDHGDYAEVITNRGSICSNNVFTSLVREERYTSQSKFPVLKQHFVGWFVKVEGYEFNEDEATMMDFDIPQNGNTRFMYVLPVNKNEALFEYTLFSEDLLELNEYEQAIKDYLTAKGILNYTVEEREMGMIPMTVFDFTKENTSNILHIGTAGGWTKASTGYTFSNISKKSKSLVEFIKQNQDFNTYGKNTKYRLYDMLFLDVLAKHNEIGSRLFAHMFEKVSWETIFKFLDDETSLVEDLGIIRSFPPFKFTKALFKRLLGIA